MNNPRLSLFNLFDSYNFPQRTYRRKILVGMTDTQRIHPEYTVDHPNTVTDLVLRRNRNTYKHMHKF